MDVTVSMKLSPKQAGALYVKAMRLEDEIKALKAERDALQAQAEVLRVKSKALVEQAERALDFDVGNHHALKGTAYALGNALDATPTACLAQVRADAVNAFLHTLEHAPSSPVSARTALGVSQWWVRFEAAKKQGTEK
jgi:hypothetical protein